MFKNKKSLAQNYKIYYNLITFTLSLLFFSKNYCSMFKVLKTVNNLGIVAFISIIAAIVMATLVSFGPITEIATYAQTKEAKTPSLPTAVFGDPIVTDKGQLLDTIVDIAQTIIFIFAAVCVLIIIWGGIKWGISGTEDGSKDGKQIIQNGVTGLIIAALSFLLIRIIFGIIQFILGFFDNN